MNTDAVLWQSNEYNLCQASNFEQISITFTNEVNSLILFHDRFEIIGDKEIIKYFAKYILNILNDLKNDTYLQFIIGNKNVIDIYKNCNKINLSHNLNIRDKDTQIVLKELNRTINLIFLV